MAQVQKYKVDIIELKKIMVEQNLDKIIDLSAASTVDRTTLSKIINGDIRPSTTVIEKLMSALHIQPERVGEIFFKPIITIISKETRNERKKRKIYT